MLGNITIKQILRIGPWVLAVLLLLSTIGLFKSNKTLKSELVTAENNIESYQGMLASSNNNNLTLKLDIENLKAQNDKVLQKVDSVMTENKIKAKDIKTITAITQTIKVEKDTVVVMKDSTFNTNINLNKQTFVGVKLRKDSLNVVLDISNDQYLYVYTKKEYKNKNKNFLQRLFTLDFKKVTKTEYSLLNSNDIIKNSDVRIIESNK